MRFKYQLFSQAIACAFAQVNVFTHYCKLVFSNVLTSFACTFCPKTNNKQNIRNITQQKKESNNR